MSLPITGLDEIDQSQAQKYLTHNTALRMLEGLMFRANSMSQDAEAEGSPGGPADGDVFILTSAATGTDWGLRTAGDVVVYNSGAWSGFTPWAGLNLFVSDIKLPVVYDGSSWRVQINAFGPLKVEDNDIAALGSPVPTAGQAFIVAAGSPQTFATDTIAIADGVGGWVTHTPLEGDQCYLSDENAELAYNGSEWVGAIENSTPTIDFATTGDLSVSYSTQVGRYQIRNGKCKFDFNLVTSSFTHSTASGDLEISLPVTVATISGYRAIGSVVVSGVTKANYTDFHCAADSAGTIMKIEADGSGQTAVDIDAGDLSSGSSVVLRGHIEYEV